jgi:hypothetical protein
MTGAAKYSAVEQLRDGRQIEIRALRPAELFKIAVFFAR